MTWIAPLICWGQDWEGQAGNRPLSSRVENMVGVQRQEDSEVEGGWDPASLAAAALIPNILLREGDQVGWPLGVRLKCVSGLEKGGVTSLTPSSTPPPLPLWLTMRSQY